MGKLGSKSTQSLGESRMGQYGGASNYTGCSIKRTLQLREMMCPPIIRWKLTWTLQLESSLCVLGEDRSILRRNRRFASRYPVGVRMTACIEGDAD